jgi:hypothetical protein
MDPNLKVGTLQHANLAALVGRCGRSLSTIGPRDTARYAETIYMFDMSPVEFEECDFGCLEILPCRICRVNRYARDHMGHVGCGSTTEDRKKVDCSM